MPPLAHRQEIRPHDEGQHRQRAPYIPPLHGEVCRRRACVEGQQREEVEPQLPQVGSVLVAQVVGQRQRGLLRVVGGEDGGAVEAPRAGKAAPLDAHGEEHGIERCHRVQRLRQERHRHSGGGCDKGRYPVHVPAPPVGQQHRQHGAQDVQHQRAQMQRRGVCVTPQGIQQQLQQVHRLGVAHDAAVYQNGVAAEEAAHGGKGQVAVQVNMIVAGQLFHRNALLSVKSDHQYTIVPGKGKGKSEQKARGGSFFRFGMLYLKTD